MIPIFFQDNRVLRSIGSEAQITCRDADFAFFANFVTSSRKINQKKNMGLFYALVFMSMNISEMRQQLRKQLWLKFITRS